MGRQLVAAMKDAGTLVAGHVWLILAAAVILVALACITSVVLVLSVDRSKRVEAIKALPPVIAALNQPASRLRALESRNKSASPEGKHS
jgi:putative exporter of polyketide antibiotics